MSKLDIIHNCQDEGEVKRASMNVLISDPLAHQSDLPVEHVCLLDISIFHRVRLDNH